MAGKHAEKKHTEPKQPSGAAAPETRGRHAPRHARRSRLQEGMQYAMDIAAACLGWIVQLPGKFSKAWKRHFSRKKKSDSLRMGLIILLAAVLIFSMAQLIGYIADYLETKRHSAQLREIYYEEMQKAETPGPPSPSPSPLPAKEASTPRPTPTPKPTLIPEATPQKFLPTIRYPQNERANVRSRFQKIRRQNKDIIGWLTIDGMLDEAVVQRDNSYYLRRDYRGYHNVNGAIFLDESCDLKTRPYTLLLYGHNMKTGEMFGSLRNYENIVYYKNNPFITFDTAYEDGRYVVFSVGITRQMAYDRKFVDFVKLSSNRLAWREEAIQSLRKISVLSVPIEVNAEDQLLLLVTCVDESSERRLVAARRIREGETEEELLRQVKNSFVIK